MSDKKYIESLQKLRAKKDFMGIIKFVHKISKSDWVQDEIQLAAKALREIWEKENTQVTTLKNIDKLLIKELENEYADFREEVAAILIKLEWSPQTETEKMLLLFAQRKWQDLVKYGQPALSFFLKGLNAKTKIKDKVQIAGFLGEIGDPRAAKPLWEYTTYEFDKYSMAEAKPIVKALAKIGKQIVPILLSEIKKPRTVVPRMTQDIYAVWVLCEMDNLNYATAIIDWILRKNEGYKMVGKLIGSCYIDGNIISAAEIHKQLLPLTTYSQLFGDYAELILDLTNWTQEKTSSNFNLTKCINALEALCRIKSPISSNLLHKVTQIDHLIISQSCQEDRYKTTYSSNSLDFSKFQQLAKSELIARGNPPYNPKAYLDKTAWHIS